MNKYKGILKFIGCGNAFNVRYGNNNAYIKKGNSLLLIDCGSLTFNKIIENKLLEGVDNLFVLITHTHSDHVGSLGDLIAYYYYILKKKLYIIFPVPDNIKKFLSLVGINDNLYNIFNEQDKYCIKTNELNILIEPVQTSHVDTLVSFGYILNYENKMIYFSGDSYEINESILTKLYNDEIDYLYQDTCSSDFNGNPHMYIDKLCQYIKPGYRKKVYCMHFDDKFEFNKALDNGFNIVEREK